MHFPNLITVEHMNAYPTRKRFTSWASSKGYAICLKQLQLPRGDQFTEAVATGLYSKAAQLWDNKAST